jgi:hypothetical protein
LKTEGFLFLGRQGLGVGFLIQSHCYSYPGKIKERIICAPQKQKQKNQERKKAFYN